MNFKVDLKYMNENNLQYAYRTIRTNILRMHLKPGEAIDEKEIASILDISRTPVHEAILLLREENLVDVQPKVKSCVSLIDWTLVQEGIDVRFAIESMVLKRVCGKLSPEMKYSIQENLMRQRFLIENNEYPDINAQSPSRFHELDNKFHYSFYIAANMEWTWKNQLKICSQYDRLRNFNDVKIDITTEYRLQLIEDHEKLFAAVANNRPEDIPEVLHRHVNSKEYFSKVYEQFKNYYVD